MAGTTAGCAQYPGASKVGGAAVGGAAGGLLGSMVGGGTGRLVATGVGAVLGAGVGMLIAEDMTRHDKKEHVEATGKALEDNPSGEPATWSNPDSGNSGKVVPTKTYRENGRYCREYQTEVTVGGEKEQGYGKACRQPDGDWKIVNADA
ncbi:RT0821/Lpp0805 family surface protein [Rhodovibrio sodomensis]|uniref:RT0821/Lpp0805 family surface protein n=1 Tax=Rhodovibrio sodomensis TaxID=1088 RepID=UPI0019079E48